MAVTIRAVLAEEIALIPTIEREAANRFREVGLAAIADGEVSSEPFIRSILLKGVALGAVADGSLVGFVLAGVLDDALHVYELSVVPAFGGRGVGSGLLAAVEAAARTLGLAAVTLSTFGDIPWNGPFYTGRGFNPVDRDEWGPAFHMLHTVEQVSGLPLERRVFMRKELAP